MPAVYRPRDPRKTPLFQLLEAHYEPVKLHWEQRFQARYGFFWGFWDQAVARYLDCGVWDNGFARIRCDTCRPEMLVPFSCKQRGLCPSCSAKRGAELGAFLIDHVKEDVGHAQWVFTIPNMLRPLFFKIRHLRGHLARLAWETVRFYSCAARGKRNKDRQAARAAPDVVDQAQPEPRRTPPPCALVCPRCAGTMRVTAFITQPTVIRRILEHLRGRPRRVTRPPPPGHRPVLATP